MLEWLKSRGVLWVALCAFILFKIPHLSYAYYWDESWPYASAIRAMHDNGLSLMPNAIDTNLSRGHPLFFHFLAAGWMKIFGPSHIAMHSFSLVVSLLLLFAVYEICLRVFNVRVAAMAVLLLASLELFVVQSSAVMPEVPVALFGLLSLYFYIRGRYVLAALMLTMLFFIKESGMVLGLLLGIDAFLSLFSKSTSKKTALLRLASVILPTIMVGIFFLVQKRVNGWYLFPLHTENLKNDWNDFWMMLRLHVISDVFCRNVRYWMYLLLALLGIIAAIKSKKARFLIILVPVYCIYYFVDNMRAGRILPGVPFFMVFIIGWLLSAWLLSNDKYFKGRDQRRFLFSGREFHTYVPLFFRA